MSGQVTILQLPTASALTGLESVPVVQNGVTVQTTTSAIAGAGALNYPFLTVGSAAGLNQGRYLSGTAGISLTDNGAGNSLAINLTGTAASLNAASQGFIVKNSASTVTNVQLTVGAGMTIANANGTTGNPLIGLNTNLQNVASLSGIGLVIVNGSTFTQTTLGGTSNQIVVTNGNAGAGAPTFGLANNPVIPGNASLTLPVGTTAQRDGGANGEVRFNSDLVAYEGFAAGAWRQFSLSGGVFTFSAGSTGFAPSSPTAGVVTLSGILNSTSGGTGASALTGYLYGNGASPATASTTIPTTNLSGTISNAQLANSAITVNGTSISLGGSGTITAYSPYALTIGTGLSGTSYNGSAAVTIAIDSTVATLTGAQTLTNKTMSGASNTFSNIPNAALSNSSITINGSAISLGGSTSVGTVTAVTGTAPVVSSGGTTPAISMAAANTTTNGYLTSTDWNTFNSKGSGSVTSVSFTGGLISVATATTTPALTVAGTSGGLVYFSSASTWASSAVLAANALIIGGGAGVAPSTITTGTGVVTALGVNTGSAGAFVVNGGALGTPSSGTVTNLTGTASININGTVGAATANTGAFTTLSASSTVSGTGFSTYLASPPAIGGTAAAAGTFTTLTNTGTAYLGGASSNQSLQVNNVASAVDYLQVAGSSGGYPNLSAQGASANVSIVYGSKGTGGHNFTTNGLSVNQFVVTHTASAVNYAQFTGATTGSPIIISAQGSDANINLAYAPKGTGRHTFYSNSGTQFVIGNTASVVNYAQIDGAATGVAPTISAQGSDANIGLVLNSKGTGVVALGGSTVANSGFVVAPVASSVNWLQVQGSTTTNTPIISALGTDANIGLAIRSKGTFNTVMQSSAGANIHDFLPVASSVNFLRSTAAIATAAPALSAQGSDTNINLNLTPKGTGVVYTASSVTAIGGIFGGSF